MSRIAGILAIGGALILISWVTSPAALTTPPDPRISPAEVDRADQTAQAVAPLSTQIDDQAARLRAHLAQPPPKPQPDRNPFRFGDSPSVPKTSSTARRAPVNGKPSYVPAPNTPAPLALPSLIAITSDARDGGLMRTAVLSIDDEMKILKPGQVFGRFLVESIGPDSVRIVDVTSPARATFIIAIR